MSGWFRSYSVESSAVAVVELLILRICERRLLAMRIGSLRGSRSRDARWALALAALGASAAAATAGGVALIPSRPHARCAPGGLRFVPATVSNPRIGEFSTLAAADFDGDRYADLVVADRGARIVRGDGNGHFSPVGAAVGVSPPANDAGVADFNRDGYLDAATAVGRRVEILLGDGHGGLVPGGTYVFPHAPRASSLAIADINGDGRPDLVVTRKYKETVVLLGDGHGGLHAAPGPRLRVAPWDIAFADVNHDGRLDMVFVDSNLRVALGDGTGAFRLLAEIATAGVAGSIAVLDSAPTFAVTTDPGSGNRVVGLLQVFRPEASGQLREETRSARPVALGPADLEGVADFDGDGKPEPLVAGDELVVLGRTGVTAVPTHFRWGPTAVADFDGDGRPDVGFISRADGQLHVAFARCGRARIVPQSSRTRTPTARETRRIWRRVSLSPQANSIDTIRSIRVTRGGGWAAVEGVESVTGVTGIW